MEAPIFILLVEDEPNFSQPLTEQLQRTLKDLGVIQIKIAASLDEAEKIICKHPFSTIQIDLRLPKSAGGVVDGTPTGLQMGETIIKMLPMSLNVLWSNYAHKHPKASHFAGQYECVYWSKGTTSSEIEPELQHHTAKTGAGAFARMLALWPLPDLEDGEISWAARFFRHGRSLLPEQLAVASGQLEQSFAARTDAQAQATLPAIFEFAEWLQRWLWAVSAACLRSATILENAPPWPSGMREKFLMRGPMQERLQGMLTLLAGARITKQNPILLRYLNIIDTVPDTLDIIAALDRIRVKRNNWAHNGYIGAHEALVELAPAVRLVMQAASFLAAWPMVTELEAVGSQWRATCVKGQWPWPKEDWSLRLPHDFHSQPGHVYQLWPDGEGRVGVLDLWPWLESRADEDLRRQRIWQVLGPSDGRNIYETSFNDLKEIRFTKDRPATPYKFMAKARWDKLAEYQ